VQTHQVLVLLYSTFLSHFTPSSPASLIQLFCSRLEMALHGQSPACGAWSSAVAGLCRSVLAGDGITQSLDTDIEVVIDKAIVLDWEEWRCIKQAFLGFFLGNELCGGRLQGLWKARLGFVVTEIPIP
jgi:hypothetical protein